MRLLVDERGWTWDDGLGRHAAVLRATPTTRCCRRRWRCWSVDLFEQAAAAPPRDHLRDQRGASWREVRAATPTTSCACAACRSSRSTPSGPCAWRTWPRSPAAHRSTASPQLHSQLLKDKVLHDFSNYFPEQVHQRHQRRHAARWFVRLANPRLSRLITEAIGEGWITDLERLRELEPLADDPEFRRVFRDVKRANKLRLVDVLADRDGHRRRPGHDARRHGQAPPRVQAADAQAAARGHPVRPREVRCRADRGHRRPAPSRSAPRPLPATGWPSRRSA